MTRELSSNEIDALHFELLVKDIVAAAETLPPFPDIAWKVTSLIKKMAPIREIEEVIRYDQAITGRILRLGRSVYYGRRYDVRSLQDAILLLGNRRLIQVIVTACADPYFSGPHAADERALWEHSVTTALMSEILSRRFNQKMILTTYTAALLHDIGKTILNVYTRIYLRNHPGLSREDRDFVRAERRALGIDHQALGGMIARNWKFPAEVTAAIEYHHDPEKAGQFQEIAAIVYMADALAKSWAGIQENPRFRGVDTDTDPVFKKFGITGKMIEEFQTELGSNMEGVRKVLRGHDPSEF